VRKITLKTCDFIDISNTAIPNNARGLDNNLASDRGCDSTTSTRRPLRPRLRSAASTTSVSTSTVSSLTTPRRPRRTR
jgi:hypothetical protein